MEISTNTPNVSDDIKKFWLAIVFLTLCLGGIVALAIVLIKADNDSMEAAKSIFNSVLPLLGAWVGAILAYYFGTKQVEATQNQQAKILEAIQNQAEQNQAITKSALGLFQSQLQHLEPIKK